MVIGAGRLRWLGYLCRIWDCEDRSVRLTVNKPRDCRREGRRAVRWFDKVGEDMKVMVVRYWGRESQGRDY